MAVTLIELAAALRLGNGVAPVEEPVRGILTRLLGVSTALVEKAAPDAPTLVRDEATIRVAGYLSILQHHPVAAASQALSETAGPNRCSPGSSCGGLSGHLVRRRTVRTPATA